MKWKITHPWNTRPFVLKTYALNPAYLHVYWINLASGASLWINQYVLNKTKMVYASYFLVPWIYLKLTSNTRCESNWFTIPCSGRCGLWVQPAGLWSVVNNLFRAAAFIVENGVLSYLPNGVWKAWLAVPLYIMDSECPAIWQLYSYHNLIL